MLSLEQILDKYAQAHAYGLASGTVRQLKSSISRYADFLGCDALAKHLNDVQVNSWIDRIRCTHAYDTVRTRRGNILALWRFAWMEGIVEQPPKRVRMPRRGRRSVVTWTPEEVKILIETADSLGGTFRKLAIPRGLWTGSLLRAGYDSGLRISDLLSFKSKDIPHSEDQPVRIVQRKTDDEHLVYFRQATILKMCQCRDALPSSRRELWPLPWKDIGDFHKFIRLLVAAAGIRAGTSKFLRRTGTTLIARDFGDEAARRHAGHRSVETTRRSYIDRSQLPQQRPLPPALD